MPIKKPKDEIGSPLFIISRTTVTLAPTGKSLFQRAPKLINSALDTVDHVRSIEKGQRGSVYIGYNSSVILTAIVGLVAAGYGVGIAPDCAPPGWSHSVSFTHFER